MVSPNTSIPYGERLTLASQKREAALNQLFDTEFYRLTSMMGPLSDGPEWPSDSSWVALRHKGEPCIVSDGLSDPWVDRDKPGTGLGLEVFIQAPDIPLAESAPLLNLADTWLFPMTAEVSHTLASYPRLCARLILGEPLSIRFNIEHIKDGRGLVGAILHTPPEFLTGFEQGFGRVSLVAATLLTGEELRWLAGKGLEGRKALLEKLYDQGYGYRSFVNRESVVS